MAKKATDEELLAQLDDLGIEDAPPAVKKPVASSVKKPAVASVKKPAAPATVVDDLAELENMAQETQARPRSRADTPRATATPKRSSEVPRRSVETPTMTPSREEKASAPVPAPAPEVAPALTSPAGGSWWGALSGAASAAVKQAESFAKEIQKNEDAQRWAEQVRGNVGALRSYGGELRSKAMPTFTSLLHTLAPPISAHERLQIHCTHDLTGYPSLDPLIYATFARVMAQVEGGELLVAQRGQESGPRRDSDVGYAGGGGSGWNDGPWWKQVDEKRDLGAVRGLVEGTKLARASAEGHAREFFADRGGVEAAAKQATETLTESNPTRKSDIFLAIQAIVHTAPADHFVEGATTKEAGVTDPPEEPEELVTFAIYLHDPVHSITFHGLAQSIPQRWTAWLDNLVAADDPDGRLPDDIREMVEAGGLDPREWVSEWIEEVLTMGVGVVAQKYVARRMGVGEGGFAKGKARQAPVDAGAGEAARAM